jgi:hypothetical protein
MSLAETQELMRTMQELMSLLNGVEAKTTQLNSEAPTTEKTLTNFRQLERVSLRYLAIARQMGLPGEAEKTIQILSQLLVMIRMVQMSMTMMASGTPFGLLMGVAGMIMSVASASSLEGY